MCTPNLTGAVIIKSSSPAKRGLKLRHYCKELLYFEKNLYKFLKKETGFTLSNYINERRIIKAQSELNAGNSANEAAASAGFKDYSVFYRSFLRKVGITPTEYIKNIDKL